MVHFSFGMFRRARKYLVIRVSLATGLPSLFYLPACDDARVGCVYLHRERLSVVFGTWHRLADCCLCYEEKFVFVDGGRGQFPLVALYAREEESIYIARSSISSISFISITIFFFRIDHELI